MKKEDFPLVVKAGSASVKIYREEKASGTYYRVGFYLGSKRKWEHCATLEQAKTEAEAKAKQLSRGDMDALQISGNDRLIYGRALEAVRSFDVALDDAAREYAAARKILGGHSLAKAAEFYMRHHGHGILARPVSEAVKVMIDTKKTSGLSVLYLADLKYRLGAFEKAFKCDVNAIAPDDVRDWLASLKLSPRSFNNFLGTLGTFFAFAQSNGWLSKEAELLAKVESRKEKTAPVEIFTPAELSALLAYASPEIAPCIALAAFAGLRSEEILRLDWTDTERRPGFIEIAAHKAKTAQRRLVPICPVLAKWLATAPRESKCAHVWPHSKPYLFESFRNAVQAENRAAAKENRKPLLAWKQNVLRHSFISYRVAELQDMNRVALEAGNSPKIIFQHYRELVTPEQAKTWFAIAPEPAANVIPMETAA